MRSFRRRACAWREATFRFDGEIPVLFRLHLFFLYFYGVSIFGCGKFGGSNSAPFRVLDRFCTCVWKFSRETVVQTFRADGPGILFVSIITHVGI